MTTRSDIVVVKSSSLPRKLTDLFSKKGHHTITLSEVRAIPGQIEKLTRPVILVYSEDSEQATTVQANQLASIPALSSYPIVFVGKGVAKHQRMLSSSIKVIEALEAPHDPNKIYDRMLNLSGYYDSEELENSTNVKPQNEIPKQEAIVKSPQTILTEPQNIKKTEKLSVKRDDPPGQILVETLDALTIDPKKLKAEEFVKPKRLTLNELMDLRPQDPKAAALAEETFVKTDEWGRSHIERVTVTSDKFINLLNPQDGFDESARAAVALYAYSFADSRQLMRQDYTGKDAESVRWALQEKIRQSASVIEKIDARAAAIISKVANIVQGETNSEEENSVAASTIMAADLLDRVCQPNGFWNPGGAYNIIRKIRNGTMAQIHPQVQSCMVVFVTEAVNSEASIFLLPKLPALYRNKIKEIRSFKKLPVGPNEAAVAVSELLPGMLVAQPILAYDGTQIIPAGLTLDHDIIFRLWQLCTVKPLLLPLVVLSGNKNFEISKGSIKRVNAQASV